MNSKLQKQVCPNEGWGLKKRGNIHVSPYMADYSKIQL